MTTIARFPIVYRVLFVVFDIILPLFGVYAHIFDPKFILQGWVSNVVQPIAIETILLWRTLQGATFLVDIFMLLGFVRVLIAENRVETKDWRQEDYQNIVGYAFIALVRLAFTLKVGIKLISSKDE